MKKHILILFLCIITIKLYSSPIRESFYIANYSSTDIIVEYEFWEEDHGSEETNYMWFQEVCGMVLIISESVELITNNIITPNEGLVNIIEYYPEGPLGKKDNEGMNNIPFMDKINAIFKSLTIRSIDGEINIDLNNLEHMYIKKDEISAGVYILEITDDYDLEQRQAKDW